MKNYEIVAEKTAYHTTAFLVKYAEFLKDMLSSNGQKDASAAFDEIIATLKCKFMKVHSQKLAEKYEPLYAAGVGNYKAEEAYFDIINGGVLEGGSDDLSLVESCLEESGIDKDVLDLRVLSGVQVSSNLKYFMSDSEMNIESIGQGSFDSTWREIVYPCETIEFGTTPDLARFEDAGEYRPLKDVMDDAIELAKAYHKTYIDTLEARVESLKEAKKSQIQELDRVQTLIMHHREDSRIIPQSLLDEADFVEECLGIINEQLKEFEGKLEAFEKNANLTFRGGKYAYKGLKNKSSSQPGEED